MRAHVRRGDAEETRQNGRLVFSVKVEQPEYVEPEPYAKLGNELQDHQPDGVWNISDAISSLPSIDPQAYFTTSGEAVKKADKLVRDFYSAAVFARSFRDKLQKARGPAKYLETQRENHMLVVKRKSPRKKKV